MVEPPQAMRNLRRADFVKEFERCQPRGAKSKLSYRAEGRVAVALEVENKSVWPWTVDAEGVALVGKGGARLRVLRVWQPEPITIRGVTFP